MRIIGFLLALLFAFPALASDPTTVAAGATVQITGPDNVCKRVTNNNSYNSLFVPTTTTAEWQSFYNNPHGATVSYCQLSVGAPVASSVNASSFAANLGTGSNDLFVCVVLWQYKSGAQAAFPSGVSVGGVALRASDTVLWANYMALSYWVGFVPAGGSQTVVISGGTQTWSSADVYVIRGSRATTDNNIAYWNPATSGTVNVASGGVVLATVLSNTNGLTFTSGVTPASQLTLVDTLYSRTGYTAIAGANAAYPVSVSQTGQFVMLSLSP